MTTRDEDLRERIKHEADELLFEGMHFDAEMQRNVRELAELDRERSRRSRRRSQQRRWLAGAGITVAAALTGLVLLFSQDGVITSPGDPPPGILVGPDDPIAPSPSGSDNELQVLKGYEEAAEAFGSTLKIPGWLPEGFALNEISVTGPRNGKAWRLPSVMLQMIARLVFSRSTYQAPPFSKQVKLLILAVLRDF